MIYTHFALTSHQDSIRRAGRRGARLSSILLVGEIAKVRLKIARLSAVERLNNATMALLLKLEPANHDARKFVLARRKGLDIASTARLETLFALAQVLKKLKWERRFIANVLRMTVESCDVNRALMSQEFGAVERTRR